LLQLTTADLFGELYPTDFYAGAEIAGEDSDGVDFTELSWAEQPL